ncbi:MAG TPA: flagellar filament capping protein FliD [Bacillota bacterium]|nr:flagellar filament capping protein FliD [Bacillota bacterium]
MVMRVGGIASGMDIESMVNKLMEAERMPLTKMQQDRTKIEWQRDAFRDVNRSLLNLETSLRNMRLPSNYLQKTAVSSQPNAVTATGSPSASDGSYNIKVSQLATNEIQTSEEIEKDHTFQAGEITIKTYDEDGNDLVHTVEVKEGDTLDQVVRKLNDNDVNVRAFYNEQSGQIVMETTRTGIYNEGGNEITVSGLSMSRVKAATDAKFTYNDGLELTSRDNNYQLNGINLSFHDVTPDNSNARITIENDVEDAFDKIVAFVDQYNEVVEQLNASQMEEKHRDFPPLTEEQKKDMSEDEIKKWEEKAQSGVIRGEAAIVNGLQSMRNAWYQSVDTGSDIKSMPQIGITTTTNYRDGGKLIIDEDKLRDALREDPEGVQNLFANSSDGEERGIANRLTDSINRTMKEIDKKAGKEFHTLENYSLGREMKDINERISRFEQRLLDVENRYWNQFTQMEKAIQRLNDQSAQLFSQFQ